MMLPSQAYGGGRIKNWRDDTVAENMAQVKAVPFCARDENGLGAIERVSTLPTYAFYISKKCC